MLTELSLCLMLKGCMNNVTFGDENVGYYETVAGGAGAVSAVLLFTYFLFHVGCRVNKQSTDLLIYSHMQIIDVDVKHMLVFIAC